MTKIAILGKSHRIQVSFHFNSLPCYDLFLIWILSHSFGSLLRLFNTSRFQAVRFAGPFNRWWQNYRDNHFQIRDKNINKMKCQPLWSHSCHPHACIQLKSIINCVTLQQHNQNESESAYTKLIICRCMTDFQHLSYWIDSEILSHFYRSCYNVKAFPTF